MLEKLTEQLETLTSKAQELTPHEMVQFYAEMKRIANSQFVIALQKAVNNGINPY